MRPPVWVMKYHGNPAYGRWVEPASVFFGAFANWVPVSAEEAHAIVGWCGVEAVVYTETRKETFFAEPNAALRDARVASRIAREEAERGLA